MLLAVGEDYDCFCHGNSILKICFGGDDLKENRNACVGLTALRTMKSD